MAVRDGQLVACGRPGARAGIAAGQEAARFCALSVLAQLHAAAGAHARSAIGIDALPSAPRSRSRPSPSSAPNGGQHLVITRDDIHRAYGTIRPYLRRTPVVQLDLTEPVTLKLEQLQYAGSFKARGAFTNLLLRDVPPAGVAAASGGNHGVAVAYAAHRLGIPARIFVPTVSSPAKIGSLRRRAGGRAAVDRDVRRDERARL